MELWFIYTLLSVIFAGGFSFIQKISTERGYPSTLTNLFSASIAAVSAILITGLFYDFNGSALLGILLAAITGVIYMFVAFFRLNSLKYIDSAIFFPLYKTFGPIFVLFIGMFVFFESFTTGEWVGIMLGILVPLMLIHKSENSRQKNLQKGVFLVVLSSFLTAIAVGVSRTGMDIFSNIFAFVAISYIFSAVSAVIMYILDLKKKKTRGEVSKHSLFDIDVIKLSVFSGIMQFGGFAMMMLAYKAGGPLTIVYTINSFYILIPIILSIIIYKEHWNARKAFAIGLSLVALAFLR